MNILNLS